MASKNIILSRRQALAGLSIIGAAAAAPAMGATALRTAISDTRDWDAAFAQWSSVHGRYDALCDRFNAAEEAHGEAHPRVDRYFDDYRLNTVMERGHVEGSLSMYNNRQRLTGGAQIDVQQVADEFFAYLKRNADSREHFRLEESWGRVQANRPAYFEARECIMGVPAPHLAALLVKIEISAISLDEGHAEAVLADARRLLGEEA